MIDLKALIQRVRDLIAAARQANGIMDYLALMPLVLDLIRELSAVLQSQQPVVMMGAAETSAMSAADNKSVAEICDDLEYHCNSAEARVTEGAFSAAEPPKGPLLIALLPLFIALAKKFLGL